MIEIKLYKYNSAQETNGYRGVDYSQYVAIASTVRDNLDDTLDAHDITLQGLNFRDEFAPSTKFVLDISQDGVAWKT